jgi:hypothetical protein
MPTPLPVPHRARCLRRRAVPACALVLGAAALLPALHARAQLPLHPPEIRTSFPLGGNRGTVVEVVAAGVNIGDATGVAVSGEGVTAEVLGPDGRVLRVGEPRAARLVSNTEVRLRFRVAPEAPLGRREFRLYTPVGLSCRGLFHVGEAAPATVEQEPNDSAPQEVTVPGTMEGVISHAEDLDRYRFQARQGESLACYVLAQELESDLDSTLAVRGPGGTLLAANEDFRGRDAALAFTAPAAGEYVVEVADTENRGGPERAYRLVITRAPFLRTTYPLGAPAGTLADISLFGLNLGGQGRATDFYSVPFDAAQARVQLPPTPPDNPARAAEFQVATPGGLTNPFPLRVLTVPDVREQEPNDDGAQAVPLPVPGAAHGRIFGSPANPRGDRDCWRLTARKEVQLRLAVVAMQAGSPLDAVLTVRGPDGKRLATVDDAGGSRDPSLEFTLPADGEYVLEVEEASGGGGLDCSYMLTAEPVRPPAPDFTLAVYPLNPSIPRGGSVPVEVRVTRQGGFAGPVRYQLPPLPEGVTALIPPESATAERFYVALTAAPDAPFAMGPFWLEGTAEIGGEERRRRATGKERVWKNAPLQGISSDLFGVAVCEPMDFTVALDRYELELRPGESREVTVIIRKLRAYPRGIPVRAATVDYDSGALPPGLSVGRVTLAAEATEVRVPVSASAQARPGEYTLFLCGLSNPTTNDYILVAHLAPPLRVRVLPP